jgi:tRNA uridine 5-carbamoylmethylation protein Kti12
MQPDPIFIMLVGLPASGKTTVRRSIVDLWPRPIVQLTTDYVIDSLAAEHGSTYNEMFKSGIDQATKIMALWRQQAIMTRVDMIHDQTNLTVKSRARKLAGLPSCYRKIAVTVKVDEGVRIFRLGNRPGKVIPYYVDQEMQQSYEAPTLAEGFDAVVPVYLWRKAIRTYMPDAHFGLTTAA